MHVLHIDLGSSMRGGQHQVLLLMKTLRKAGHSGTLMARPGSPLFQHARDLRFPVEPAALFALRRISAQHDVVHAHDAHAHTWAALLSRQPFVVSRRVAFPVGTSLVSRWKYGRAARYLAVSNFVSLQLQKAGVAENRIDIVYDSVEPPNCQQAWSADAPVIALASLDPLKGRDLIQRASEMANIPVVFSNDLNKDFLKASAFVYISRSEGLGSAALLAMSCGVPVIASRVDGMVEVFEDGVSGIAVENNPAEIAAAINRVIKDPALALRLIANGRQRVEAIFSTSALIARTLASYRRAIVA